MNFPSPHRRRALIAALLCILVLVVSGLYMCGSQDLSSDTGAAVESSSDTTAATNDGSTQSNSSRTELTALEDALPMIESLLDESEVMIVENADRTMIVAVPDSSDASVVRMRQNAGTDGTKFRGQTSNSADPNYHAGSNSAGGDSQSAQGGANSSTAESRSESSASTSLPAVWNDIYFPPSNAASADASAFGAGGADDGSDAGLNVVLDGRVPGISISSPDRDPISAPLGVLDVDGNLFVDDPEGQLADISSGAASASSAAAASGADAVADTAAGTAIDDDNDLAAVAQSYAGAVADDGDASIAVAVAAAVDNNVIVGEPEIETEAEVSTDEAGSLIEIYADASVLAFSQDVTGQDSGTSLVIETAIVIIRDNEIVIVTADGSAGTRTATSTTTGSIVAYEQTFSIDGDESILGTDGELPTSVGERILAALSSSSFSSGETTPSSGGDWQGTDQTLDEFVSVMLSTIDNSDPAELVTFDDGDTDVEQPEDLQTAPNSESSSTEPASVAAAEAEAEAEADANQVGGAAAAAAAASSASSASADSNVFDDASSQQQADEPTDNGTDQNPTTVVSTATSTQAESSTGDDQVADSGGQDDVELQEPLEQAVAGDEAASGGSGD